MPLFRMRFLEDFISLRCSMWRVVPAGTRIHTRLYFYGCLPLFLRREVGWAFCLLRSAGRGGRGRRRREEGYLLGGTVEAFYLPSLGLPFCL
jgi:hypothetical protein